jgi:hypothetical protein
MKKIILKYPIIEIIISGLWLYPFFNFVDTMMIKFFAYCWFYFARAIAYVSDFFMSSHALQDLEEHSRGVGIGIYIYAILTFFIFKIIILVFVIRYFNKWKKKYL